MNVDLDNAARYRVHAEELRTIAEDAFTSQGRKILLGLAADYEQMAQSLEAIDRTNKAMAKRVSPDTDDDQ